MKRLILALATGLLALTGAAPLAAQTRLELNEIVEIGFDAEAATRVRLELEEASLIWFDVFAGDDAITAVQLGQPASGEADTTLGSVLVLGPGRHDLDLVATGPGGPAAGRIQGRISARPPNDGFEPNDTRDTAVEVDLPFNRIVRLSQGDWDWFLVDPPRAGVLGIHLHAWRSPYTGPLIRVESLDGETLYANPNTPGAWNGMRYVNVTGEPVRIGLTDGNNWPDHQWHGYKALEIVLIEPIGAMRGQLITLGLEGEDGSLLQLAEIGHALGTELRAANEAEAVSTELLRAVEQRRPAGPGRLVWGLLVAALLVLAGGGACVWHRRSAVSSPDAPS